MTTSKMKILFYVNNLSYGGTERTVSYLSDYFIKQGHKVIIILNENKVFYNMNNKINFHYVDFNRTKGFINNILKITEIRKKVKKIVEREKPDVIFPMGIKASLFSKYFKSKATLITSVRYNPNDSSFFRKRLAKYFLNQADGIIFQTNDAKTYFSEKIRSKGVVIQNAVGNKDIYGITNNQDFNKDILAIGRLSKEKDYNTMLEAFKLVLEDFPDYILKIYGEGKEKHNLIELTKKLEIYNSVYFKGVSKNVIIDNVNSRCYVLSSISEGMPNSLIEAMAAGIPSISTDCNNGPRDIIINNKNGILVDVGNVTSLANAIKSIIEDRNLSIQFSKEGQKLLETNSINNISQQYLNFIIEKTNVEKR